jgi:hypothetical protein
MTNTVISESSALVNTGVFVLEFHGYDVDSDSIIHFKTKKLADEMMEAINKIMPLLPIFPWSMAEDEEQEWKKISDNIVLNFPRPSWCSLELFESILRRMEYQIGKHSNKHANITLSVKELVLEVYG